MRARAAAVSPGLGKATVGNCLVRFSQAGLSWPLPPERNDDNLELLRFPGPAMALRPDRPVPAAFRRSRACGTMGASNDTCAGAVASEGLQDWILAHVRMFALSQRRATGRGARI